ARAWGGSPPPGTQGRFPQAGGALGARGGRGAAWMTFAARIGAACLASEDPTGMTRILLSDDKPALRSLLRRQLEGAGHQILEAQEGSEAFRLLEHHSANSSAPVQDPPGVRRQREQERKHGAVPRGDVIRQPEPL